MVEPLIHDPEFRATTFVVIDFEATTPVGHRPEPIEVAALCMQTEGGRLVESDRFCTLIRPPDHAPVTYFDTQQTGIVAAMLAGQPPAGEVLSALDCRLPDCPLLLVAHNAATEAGILHDYAGYCPRLATTHLLDTVKLARTVYPSLRSHGLDALMEHLQIPCPADRHRALPDVEVAVHLFGRLLADGARDHWPTLARLRWMGDYEPKSVRPRQESLFE